MPQNPLPIDNTPPDERLVLEVEDLTLQLVDSLRVTVRLARVGEQPSAFGVIDLDGHASDLLGTVLDSLGRAWAHSDRRELLRVIQREQRQARAYLREYDHS